MLELFRMDGEVAIITGGASGIGAAIASTFGDAGAYCGPPGPGMATAGHTQYGHGTIGRTSDEAHARNARSIEQFGRP